MLFTPNVISECEAGLLLSQDTTVVVPPATHKTDRAISRDYGAPLKLLMR
jgi:hypothetical protein